MKANKRHLEFLQKYEKLCQEYKMGLWGCGCCESPTLIDYDNNGDWDYVDDLENINFNKDLFVTIEPMGKLEMKLNEIDIEVLNDKD